MTTDTSLASRIRTLAIVEAIMMIALGIVIVFLVAADKINNLLFAGAGLCVVAVMYAMSHHRWAKGIVILNMLMLITLIGLVDIFSTELTGAAWILYLIWPPLTMLIVREVRWVIFVSLYDLAIFITFALLEINQVVPIQLLMPPDRFYTILSINVITLITITFMMTIIGNNQTKIYNQAQAIAAELRQQEAATAQANNELQANNQQLQTILAEQHRLSDQITQLEGSAIRLRQGVFLLPLIGILNTTRLESVGKRVLRMLHSQRATQLVIDMTSAVVPEATDLNTLTEIIESIKLLGCSVHVTGISPDLVRDMVLHNIDMRVFEQTGQLDQVLYDILNQK